MRRNLRPPLVITIALMAAFAISAYAAPDHHIAEPTRFTDVYQRAVGQWIATGQQYIGALFAVLAAADLTWFGVEYWLNRHDFEGMLMASLRKVFAIGFFLALAMHGEWFKAIIDGFVFLGKQGSGVQELSPSTLLQQGANIAGTILRTGRIYIALMPPLFDGYIVGAAGAFAGFLIISLQFSMTLVDSYIAAGLATYFLWLGASRWTVSYVERYFAFCVAVGVKLMAMYLLVGMGWFITNEWEKQAAQNTGPIDNIVNGWIIAVGALFFAFLCWHCSKLVSSALGGSPTLTGSDAVAFFGAIASTALAASAAIASAGAGAGAGAAGAAGAGAGRAAAAAGASRALGPVVPPMSSGLGIGGTMPPPPKPPAGYTPTLAGMGPAPVPTRPPGSGSGSGLKTALQTGQRVADGIRGLPPDGHSGGTPQSPVGH
jgi:type IV secretion system protein TrbL